MGGVGNDGKCTSPLVVGYGECWEEPKDISLFSDTQQYIKPAI